MKLEKLVPGMTVWAPAINPAEWYPEREWSRWRYSPPKRAKA